MSGNFVVAAIAVAGAVNGSPPIADRSSTVVVQVLEGLLAGVAVSMLILGAVLAERAATETRLTQARAMLAEAQEIARTRSWDWNIAGDVVTWSDEMYRLFGLPPQSIPVTSPRSSSASIPRTASEPETSSRPPTRTCSRSPSSTVSSSRPAPSAGCTQRAA